MAILNNSKGKARRQAPLQECQGPGSPWLLNAALEGPGRIAQAAMAAAGPWTSGQSTGNIEGHMEQMKLVQF